MLRVKAAHTAGKDFADADFFDIGRFYANAKYNVREDEWPAVQYRAVEAFRLGGRFQLAVWLIDSPGDFILWDTDDLHYLAWGHTFFDSRNYLN